MICKCSNILCGSVLFCRYSYDAVKELNVKAKNWKDLLNNEAFRKKDIIMLQDPTNPDLRNMDNYKAMHEHYMASKSEKETLPEDVKNIRTSAATDRIFKDIAQKRKRKEEEQEAKMRVSRKLQLTC